MDPLVVFIVMVFILSVAAGGWVLGTIRQMKIRNEEMDSAEESLRICSDAFNSINRRFGIEAGKLIEAKVIIKNVKETEDAYIELPVALKTRIDLFLKRRK